MSRNNQDGENKPKHDPQIKKAGNWDKLLSDLDDIHARKFNAYLLTADEEDFVSAYLRILEYAKPKLTRSEGVDPDKDNVITIVHRSAEYKDAEPTKKE